MYDRAKIIAHITERNKDRFRVFDNTGSEKKVIGGQFPDMIFMRQEPPPNSDVLFIMRIETGTPLIDSVSIWQGLGSTTSVFYIVVPKEQLDEAKKLVSATNVRARFASYEMEGDKVNYVKYE